MSVIRLTKEFSFEMAHFLPGYDGLCSNVHGHSYLLHVTVAGSPSDDPSSPKFGMVMDFSDLKKIVGEEVVGRLDHALMVRRGSVDPSSVEPITRRLVEVDYQPTCENMLVDFAGRISRRLPCGVRLVSLRLNETATSFAEWRAEDNA
ncbi:MAG: 6-pyruvoyl trahydropterin synthase family protein [Marinilabiliaceae bacterium]